MTYAELPDKLYRMNELSYNLWWSWHPEARNVFRTLDYELWKLSGHNPVKELRLAKNHTLESASNDPAFMASYDSVLASFDKELSAYGTYYKLRYPDLVKGYVAYFSMEYAIHNSLPIYAGGLGVLAGDICKEASDMGVPFVAIGFMYPQGYFHQRIEACSDICQREYYEQLDFEVAPINRLYSEDGSIARVQVPLGDVDVEVGIWVINVGRTRIYLLDTNLEENPTMYRGLSARLYVSDREQRLQQEIVLGVGGVKVLKMLGIDPVVWHSNEGHTAFTALERIREAVQNGAAFSDAVDTISKSTVFTTHTPVIAGHDVFPDEMVKRYLDKEWKLLGIDPELPLRLGQQEAANDRSFNMTVLSMRTASHRCAVSRLHGEVTRRMWNSLWPDKSESEVPIGHITNGVHVPSWIAPELYDLFAEYLGGDWIKRHDDSMLWQKINEIPDRDLWSVHLLLKNKLISTIRLRARNRWSKDNTASQDLPAMGTLLDPEVLTLTFARRFTEYKRPGLIFSDIERLKRILTDKWHPVQIVFAGKSHPADIPSKMLVSEVYKYALDRDFQGRIAFVENHDMHLTRYLVHGSDVWLNTPRRYREASGTSGMKAALNGVLHLSIRDGWWHEGYNGNNGWVIGPDYAPDTSQIEDDVDASSIYNLLENEIVPSFYDRDRNGIPHGWMHMVKRAISSIVPFFSARRMLNDYVNQMYAPIIHGSSVSSKTPQK